MRPFIARRFLFLPVLFVACGTDVSAALPVFSDDFATTAFLAEKWKTTPANAWKIEDGALRTVATDKSGSALPLGVAVKGPVEVTCRVKPLAIGTGGWCGVTVRGIHFTFSNNGFWHVYTVVGQPRASGGIQPEKVAMGRWHEFRIVRRGEFVRWFVDGALVAHFRESNAVVGEDTTCSLDVSKAGAAYDDIAITPLTDDGAVSPNFLRNASFETVPDRLPTYWKPAGIATVPQESFWPRWSVVEANDARHGKRVLRVEGRADEKAGFMSHNNTVTVGQPCTFSIDLKADKPAMKARMILREYFTGKSTNKTIEIGAEWSRYSLTLDKPGNAMRAGVQLEGEGVIWADAAQLELGGTTTPFALSLFDEEQPAPRRVSEAEPAKAAMPPSDHTLRSILVDGKPAFVIAPLIELAATGSLTQIDAPLKQLADHGFRTVMVVTKIDAPQSDAMWRHVFEQCAARQMKVVVWPAGFSKLDPEKLRELIGKFRAFVARWKSHPSVIAWLPVDEPELYASAEDTRLVMDAFREADPDHPAFVNNTVGGIPSRFAGLPGDILSVDDYLTNRERRDVREIVRNVDVMNEAGAPTHRPTWIFIVGNNLNNHYREPTAGEQIAQSYGCAIAGATGLLYFYGIPTDKGNWSALCQVNRELTTLAPVLLSSEPAPAATCSSSVIRLTTRCFGGAVHLITVNLDDAPVTARFEIEDAGSSGAAVMFENRAISVKSGAIEDSFAPHGRHVYRLEAKTSH